MCRQMKKVLLSEHITVLKIQYVIKCLWELHVHDSTLNHNAV
jgi:hypothetical protein